MDLTELYHIFDIFQIISLLYKHILSEPIYKIEQIANKLSELVIYLKSNVPHENRRGRKRKSEKFIIDCEKGKTNFKDERAFLMPYQNSCRLQKLTSTNSSSEFNLGDQASSSQLESVEYIPFDSNKISKIAERKKSIDLPSLPTLVYNEDSNLKLKNESALDELKHQALTKKKCRKKDSNSNTYYQKKRVDTIQELEQNIEAQNILAELNLDDLVPDPNQATNIPESGAQTVQELKENEIKPISVENDNQKYARIESPWINKRPPPAMIALLEESLGQRPKTKSYQPLAFGNLWLPHHIEPNIYNSPEGKVLAKLGKIIRRKNEEEIFTKDNEICLKSDFTRKRKDDSDRRF